MTIEARNPLPRRPRLQFAYTFLKDPKITGSIFPSSRYLVDRMLRQVQWKDVKVVIELGPGLGCFTREILRCLGSNALLLALEKNVDFVTILRTSIRDPRAYIVNSCAEGMRTQLAHLGVDSTDCIISGLPFLNMPKAQGIRVLEHCRDVLSPGGSLVLFQYRRTLSRTLRLHFASVKCEYELLNLPPAHVFSCTK
jgi:phospholipid N-methyltransferase